MTARALGPGRSLGDRLLDPVTAAVAASCLLFLWLPVGVLLLFSFSGARQPHVWGGFSTKWYEALLDHPDVARTAANSFSIAASVAVVSTVLGSLLALGLDRRARVRPTAAHDAAVMVPILVPDVVQGISLLLAFVLAFGAMERLFGTAPTLGRTTVVLAHTAFATSYVTILVRTRLRSIPRALEEAALDLGATPAQAFRRVTLPLLAPAVLGGALLAFTLSLDEYVLTFFTSGPGSDTLPVWIASAVRRGQATPVLNALSALLVVGSVVLVSSSVLAQRGRRPAG
jgi:ABC-type spermidine/putrescine transport system permease subunit II